MGTECMMHESIWFDRHVYEEAEERNQLLLNGLPLPVTHDHHHGHGHHGHHGHHGPHDHGKHHGKNQHDHHGKNQHDHHGKDHHEHHGKNQHHDHHGKHHDHHGKNQHHGKHGKGASTSVMEIAEARRKIHETLTGAPHGASHGASEKRIEQLEAENKQLRQQTNELAEALKKLELRVAQLESTKTATAPTPTPAKEVKKEVKKEEESDDDLFGSDSEEEDEEQERIKQERLAAYNAKKAKKPKVIAKSSITIDVKPWDDETDVSEMEKKVRSVATDGLVWGASKIIPVAYGIKKLQITCIVEDDKCGSDFLEEEIQAFEDLVQSIDVVAFNKL